MARFHAERPGITEDVLARCTDDGGDGTGPYAWLLDGVDPGAVIVDLGCGSGPARPDGALRWVGLDRSVAELARARVAGRTAVARADAGSLPVPTGAADVVTCSMAMMLVRPLDAALAEVARVLRPGGELRLLLPARRPLTLRDRLRYLPLFWAARATTSFPPTPLRRHAHDRLRRFGLPVHTDGARRFVLDLDGVADAERLVDSWYLPRVPEHRRAAARARAAALVPTTFGLPLRRVVARRDDAVTPRPAAGAPEPRPG